MPEIEPQPVLGSGSDWAMAMKPDPADPSKTVPDMEARGRFWAFHAKQQAWNERYAEPVVVFWPALMEKEGRFRLLAVQVKTIGELGAVRLALAQGEAKWIPVVELLAWLKEEPKPAEGEKKEDNFFENVMEGMRLAVEAYDLKKGRGEL